MKSFKQFMEDLQERCWTGYKPVPGKKAYSKGSCVKEDGGAGGAAAGGMSVGGIAGTGDSRLPSSQREPGVSRKKKAHNPVMMGMARRKPPKI